MINRLPKQFLVSAANGSAKNGQDALAAPSWLQRAVDAGGRCIARRPVASLSAALITGIVVGRLVKR